METCPICLEPAQDRHVFPTCGHSGCAVCLSRWRMISNRCPLCQRESLFLEADFAAPKKPLSGERATIIRLLAQEKDMTALLTSDLYLAFVKDMYGFSITQPSFWFQPKYGALIDRVIARYRKQVDKYPASFWASADFQARLRDLDWTREDVSALDPEYMRVVASLWFFFHWAYPNPWWLASFLTVLSYMVAVLIAPVVFVSLLGVVAGLLVVLALVSVPIPFVWAARALQKKWTKTNQEVRKPAKGSV